MNEDFAVLKHMLENPRYKKSLIERIKTGKAGPSLVNMLKGYARGADAAADPLAHVKQPLSRARRGKAKVEFLARARSAGRAGPLVGRLARADVVGKRRGPTP